MRDLLIIALVVAGALIALRRPWVGVLTWTWLSIMNPHRFAWGPAYDAPLAALAAASTLLGLLITKDKTSPFKGSPAVWLFIFMAWMTISWLMGLSPARDYEQWNKVMKIDLMILVALALIHTKKQIMLLMWVTVGSLALLGVKGGVFTILHGGSYRVWGPPGSFIFDNNEFALSLVMIIPLLRFLQTQVQPQWAKHGLTASMLLCAAAALGSQSRGGLLAIVAMALFLWWRGGRKIMPALIMLAVGAALIAFMPDSWEQRMSTIQTFEQDRSAMGRISAWWNAWNIAWHYPFGVGFNAARPELFARFSPYPDYVHAAHSIYFQVLGNHGFVGLFLFLAIWISTWRSAGWLMRVAPQHPQAVWCRELGAMAQVMLVAYAIGGAFLSLSYFDLPYNLMVIVVCARVWLQTQAWNEPAEKVSAWQLMLGCGPTLGAPLNRPAK